MNKKIGILLIALVVLSGAGLVYAGYTMSPDQVASQSEDCTGRLCSLSNLINSKGE